MPRPPLILSVQSFCVHSTVGQKAASFPLNALGFDVDQVNTVLLSNHKGYAQGWTGRGLEAAELGELVEGLRRNGILGAYTHLLAGYVGSVDLLMKLVGVLDEGMDKDVVFLCDPVLGDNGKFYVPPEMADVYVKHVIPKATVLTPNQFEAEVLTGVKITDQASAFRVCDCLHAMGVPIVIITSCNLTESPAGHATMVASTWTPPPLHKSPPSAAATATAATTTAVGEVFAKRLRSSSNPEHPSSHSMAEWKAQGYQHQRIVLDFLLIPGRYVGTGDLTAALILGWLITHPHDFVGALEKACWTVGSVISRTKLATDQGTNPFGELKLVSSLDEIRNPQRLGPARCVVG